MSAIGEIESLVARGDDADGVLREVVAALVRGGCAYAAILFTEGGELAAGPAAGTPEPASRVRAPVVWRGTRVAELVVDGCPDGMLLERVPPLIAELCLVGWDTAGEPWTP